MPRSNRTSSERKEYLRNAKDLEPLTQPLTGGRFNYGEIVDTFGDYREADLTFAEGLETELEPHDFGNPTDTWLPPLRVLLTRILLLVRLLFIVDHEADNDEYIRVCYPCSGLHRPSLQPDLCKILSVRVYPTKSSSPGYC